MRWMNWVLLWSLVTLAACGPPDQRKAEVTEKRRIECLDKFCEGDVEPKLDRATEVALKLNGQWYVGPKEYFSNMSGAVFYWPSKTPEIGRPDGQPYPEKGKPFYDVAIEVFLSSPKTPGINSTYQLLLAEEASGHVVEKRKLRDGLEAWKTKSGTMQETWFIATDLLLPTGEPATVACRGDDPTKYRCTGGFLWTPDIAAGLRFRATHGPDWPEIYVEINRVLKQLRRG